MATSTFRRWRQVPVAMIVQGVSAVTIIVAYSIVAVPLQKEFGSSRMMVMLSMTAMFLVNGFLSPFIGTAIDRYSLRILMLVGSVLLAAGFFAVSLTTSMLQVVLIYAVFMALATPLLGPLAASALLARWFTRRRGFALGIAALGIPLCGLIFPPLIQFLVERFEWRPALRILSAIILALLVPIVALLTIERPSPQDVEADGAGDAIVAADHGKNHQYKTTGAVLHDTNFWLIAIIMGVVFSESSGLLSNMVPLVIGKGFNAAEGALLLSLFSAGSFAGKSLFALVGDRVGTRLALAATLLTLLVGLLGLLLPQSHAVLVLGAALIGLAVGAMVPLWGFLIAQGFGPENVGRVMGLMNFVTVPGTLSAPPLLGWVFDRTGSYDYGLITCLGLVLLLLLLLPRIRTQSGPKTQSQAPRIGIQGA